MTSITIVKKHCTVEKLYYILIKQNNATDYRGYYLKKKW